MRSLPLLVLLIATCIAHPVFAAPNTTHGQACDTDITVPVRGEFRTSQCINLCNNYAAADDGAECTEYEFKGVPNLIVFEREENDANCTNNPTFTLKTGPVTGGTPSYDLDSTAVVLNDADDRIIIIVESAPPDAFLFITVTDDLACTDVDVRMYLITEY